VRGSVIVYGHALREEVPAQDQQREDARRDCPPGHPRDLPAIQRCRDKGRDQGKGGEEQAHGIAAGKFAYGCPKEGSDRAQDRTEEYPVSGLEGPHEVYLGPRRAQYGQAGEQPHYRIDRREQCDQHNGSLVHMESHHWQ